MRAFFFLLLFFNGVCAGELTLEVLAQIVYSHSSVMETMLLLLEQQEETLKYTIACQEKIIKKQKRARKKQKKLKEKLDIFENMLFGAPERVGILSRITSLESAHLDQQEMNSAFMEHLNFMNGRVGGLSDYSDARSDYSDGSFGSLSDRASIIFRDENGILGR